MCCDPSDVAAHALADELGWRAGDRAEAVGADVVCCVTPGREPVIDVEDLRPGLHLNMLGADGPGKAEATVQAVAGCTLFCDEWSQASHGGELTGAIEAGLIARGQVTELGAVLAGDAPGRPADEAVTLFDSTGVAIQDLAVARRRRRGLAGRGGGGADGRALGSLRAGCASGRPPGRRRRRNR